MHNQNLGFLLMETFGLIWDGKQKFKNEKIESF